MKKIAILSLMSLFTILSPLTSSYASDDQPGSDDEASTSLRKPVKSGSPSTSSEGVSSPSIGSTSAPVSSVEQLSQQLEGTSIAPSKTWGNSFTNFYFNATFNAEVEMAKFPKLSIAILLEQLKDDDEHLAIQGKKYEYRTGTNESASDYYAGWLHFTSLDYGEAEHKYISPQQGFDRSVTLISRKNEVKPHEFIGKLVRKGVIATDFLKGTPYKNDASKTCIEYIIYSRAGNRYISVKAFRDLNEVVH